MTFRLKHDPTTSTVDVVDRNGDPVRALLPTRRVARAPDVAVQLRWDGTRRRAAARPTATTASA